MTLQRALFLSLIKSQNPFSKIHPDPLWVQPGGVWWRSRQESHCCITTWTHRDNKETLHSTATLEMLVLSLNTVCQPAFFSISTLFSYTGVSPFSSTGVNQPLSHFSVNHMLPRRSSPVTAQWQRKYSRLEETTHCSPQDGRLVGYRDTLSPLSHHLRHLDG